MKNSYCVCVIHYCYANSNNTHMAVSDILTFPNPEKDPNAEKDCLERAKFLPKIIRDNAEFRKRLNIPNAFHSLRIEAIHYREL